MKNIKKIICWVAFIGWMVLIFYMSAQHADESSATSGRITGALVRLFNPDYESWDSAKQESVYTAFSYAVRKLAHFMEYFILGCLTITVITEYNKARHRWAFAWMWCVLYASSDEIHQLFVPGRAGRVFDVCVDSSGALLGIVAICLLMKVFKKRGNL